MNDALHFSSEQIREFQEKVLHQGKRLYRELPWRNIDDPYHVLVSEIMLQQTQVVRVIGYWERFISLFPTIDALASAETALVLEQWQGLGYNRRALMLKKAAEVCAKDYEGAMPVDLDDLLLLPGVGPATAAGVRAFAHNLPGVYLETNVRTVLIHEFFSDAAQVKDKDLIPLLAASCPEQNPRTWYYALLDYGAYLKKATVNPSRKSAHYAKQSSFEGSRRQKRAEILRLVLADSGISKEKLSMQLNEHEVSQGRSIVEEAEFDSIIKDLVKEEFFSEKQENGQFVYLA